jgi:hypothetical protein
VSANGQPDYPLLDAAILLVDRGFWVTPTVNKRPYVKAWGLTKNTADGLRAIWKPEAGPGIILGPGRAPDGRWLIDIEGDGPEAENSYLRLVGGELIETYGWSSVRSPHRLFTANGERLLDLLAAAGAVEGKGHKVGTYKLAEFPDLEFRIGGYFPDGQIKQFQSVAPPTPGTDGTPRRWNYVDTIAELPETAYAALEAIAERKAIQSGEAAEAQTLPIRQPLQTTVTTGTSAEDRARAYLATIEPAVSGKHGHDKTFYAACRIGPGFDLPYNVAFRLLMEYSKDCKPPWSEKEIKHKLDDAYKVEKGRGFLLNAPLPSNGKPVQQSYKSRAQLEDEKLAEEQKAFDQLLATYRPKTFGGIASKLGELVHLWPNWLVLGNVTMIWSKPKIGKTRFYIGLMKPLWFGTDFPDGCPNPWGPGVKALVIPYDRNHQEIHKEMKLAGIPDEAAVCPYDPRDETGASLMSITDPLMLKLIEKILSDDKSIKLIVIDTLTYASEKSLSKPEDMKVMLDGIMLLALKVGVSVLCLIHENKEGEALGRRINERARVLCRLERYSEADPKRLRLFVKESNFEERPSITVVHEADGVHFEKDQGKPAPPADRRDDCARWLIDYLWKKPSGVEVDFGTLIDDLGQAGFAGTWNPTEKRWSDRQLLNRAINAINTKAPSLEEFHSCKGRRLESGWEISYKSER